MTIPGIPVPTPIFAVLLVGLLLLLIFRFTSLSMYTQSVGINKGAARLNGINPTAIQLLSFVLLGICVSVAGVIGVCRLGQLNHKTLLVDIEMDAILRHVQDGFVHEPGAYWVPRRLGGGAPTPEEAAAMDAQERAKRAR